MEDLVESILDYVRADYTDYAIMINGEWGSGKTYFWNNKIRPKIDGMQFNGKKYSTIHSLQKLLALFYRTTSTRQIAFYQFSQQAHCHNHSA